jgi:hypothetical protein
MLHKHKRTFHNNRQNPIHAYPPSTYVLHTSPQVRRPQDSIPLRRRHSQSPVPPRKSTAPQILPNGFHFLGALCRFCRLSLESLPAILVRQRVLDLHLRTSTYKVSSECLLASYVVLLLDY